MEMPLVSIIVPVYNAQSHLSRCLESICGQEYKNLELIVINDGSKDKSLPVCEEFRKKDSRILLVDKANSGVSDTRNLGLKLAGGKYVQFVDSDDYIAPDYTARLVEAAEKTGADLVISPYTMVIPAGASKPEQVLEKIQDDLGVMHVARPPENREYGFLPEGVYDKDTFARRLMDKPASYFYSVLWNKLYRRDILTRHDIRFTSEMRWAEDLVFNMQYIQYAEVFASIPQPGYYYVQNPQSICHTQIKPATLVQNKIQVFHYYKDLYTRLGMYEQVRPQLYKFLIDIAESTYPSGPFKKVIDGTVFVEQRKIPFRLPEGAQCGRCERPLRASSASGERVALAASETVPAGTVLEFSILVMNPKDAETVREWLDYGRLRGLFQWRNSGKGRFEWEEVA